ncbi:MAG: cell death suppressor protein Lls1, partial [Phormidium sp.]
FVFELRQWVNQYSVDPFPNTSLPPALSRDKLLDRYHSHTTKCNSCSTALANIQKVRLGLGVGVAFAWTITPIIALLLNQKAVLPTALLTLLSLAFGAVWLYLGKLEKRFYQGENIPRRNMLEKGNK